MGVTRNVEWRKNQLRQLKKGIQEMTFQMTEAVKKDLGKSAFVTCLTFLFESFQILQVIGLKQHQFIHFVKVVNLDTPLQFSPSSTKIIYEPLGVVLIYGSWNYPFVVTLKPLYQAIASGNCALIKPSELAPHSSAVIKLLVQRYLDESCYDVIEGGPEVAVEVQKHKFDLICFTGSSQKGKLVATGGKCPAVVDESANIDLAAAKISFARFNNSGQTCIATDYVLVHDSIQDIFIKALKNKLDYQYGYDQNGNPWMGKVVTEWHCERLQNLIETSQGEIVCGGKVKKDLKFVEPTIIVNPKSDSAIMEEEIFGPLLPVITYRNIDEVINFINQKDKPLALYYFGKYFRNENRDKLVRETSSGSFVQNDVLIHMLNHEFGFGGVGFSGYGRYGGYEGFKCWSNPKSVMYRPALNFKPLNSFSPPFDLQKQRLLRKLLKIKGSQTKVIGFTIAFLVIAIVAIIVGVLNQEIHSVIKDGCREILD
ncbi:aldehyde dehydrogenase [Stylonychia lemnae]|uniref:Aldehyde dehydrogenase n=1 Tax=Stylonychia lemnae TaxID=5949 RepID=A0A078BBJ4_STYLE|nr:aldehyde dehydrogenase [Stylonychia lemnae]|eukprot:CDW90637.1 aldehyde dehydrogenase [Stylonychia lemnae]